MADISALIKSTTFDVAAAATELPRFDFVLVFVARMTKKAKDRSHVSGMQVKYSKQGWTWGFPDVGTTSWNPPQKDAGKVVDIIRRSPLNVYVQEAEHLRVDAHAMSAKGRTASSTERTTQAYVEARLADVAVGPYRLCMSADPDFDPDAAIEPGRSYFLGYANENRFVDMVETSPVVARIQRRALHLLAKLHLVPTIVAGYDDGVEVVFQAASA